jgi:hypothetical protein
MMNELMIDISVDEDCLPSAGTNEEFSPPVTCGVRL